ncbi:fungal specific transcription factor factor [Fusarium heterosporum]|uniref:Fungal specific transcription factor factor n=1 Tax=Fusarium heterosporum TaxID=42747 RepID=A0A8H5TWR6_FUSHE|nr:fungal specific transcription factor factor [Fusarium heterosporum]
MTRRVIAPENRPALIVTKSSDATTDIEYHITSNEPDTQPTYTATPSASNSPSSVCSLPLSHFPCPPDQLAPLAPLHPDATTHSFLWQTYIDVVDPTLKLFHVLNTQRELTAALHGSQDIDVAMECLMFAVYYAVIVTMPASECQKILRHDRSDLLHRYRLGAETALLRANFICSSNLKVLQAFVIYLTFVRKSDDEPDIRSLTSLLVGSAMRMGLQCEEAAPQSSPFETEMRRRLWWQVYVLDVRNAMECDLDPIILEHTFNTKKPRNVNDYNLSPYAETISEGRDGSIAMELFLFRILGTELTRKIIFSKSFNKANGYPDQSVEEKCESLDELCETEEMRNLTCGSSRIPLNIVASATAKLICAKLKVMVKKPQPDQGRGNPFRENYLDLCLDVLRESHTVRCYKPGQPWSWLFENCVEWDAMAYVLLDLCVSPSSHSSGVAWGLVSDIFGEWKGDTNLTSDRRWRPIEALWLEAVSARESFYTQTPHIDGGSNQEDVDGDTGEGLHLGYQVRGRVHSLEPRAISDTGIANLDIHGINEIGSLEHLSVGVPDEWCASLLEQYWKAADTNGASCSFNGSPKLESMHDPSLEDLHSMSN